MIVGWLRNIQKKITAGVEAQYPSSKRKIQRLKSEAPDKEC